MRCPSRDTIDRRLTAPEPPSIEVGRSARHGVDAVVQPAEDSRPAEVALLEGHQHLVAHFGQHRPAAILAGPELHRPGPVADVVVGEPREGQLDPAGLLRVVGVADLGDDHARLAAAGPAATGGQAEQGAVVAAADRERRWCSRWSGRSGAARW